MPLPNTGGLEVPRAPGLNEDLGPTPRVGEHSRDVLAELGLPTETIDTLVARGVVVCNGGDDR